jgi:hypothetical protein
MHAGRADGEPIKASDSMHAWHEQLGPLGTELAKVCPSCDGSLEREQIRK